MAKGRQQQAKRLRQMEEGVFEAGDAEPEEDPPSGLM